MTLVLDSGGLSKLVQHRTRLEEVRRRGQWPALVPAVVLTEALTGDHRRKSDVGVIVTDVVGPSNVEDGYGAPIG